jgi:lactate dehydrogenase-like 2-hydroxyacid dehydrogenase
LLEDRDAIILRSGVAISASVMEMAPKLELATRRGSGFDNIDVQYCSDHGFKVARVPGRPRRRWPSPRSA